jgi:hypothetical protein
VLTATSPSRVLLLEKLMQNENVNPWIVQAPKAFKALPNGAYLGVFKGVEDYELQSSETKWRFLWEVSTGPHKGETASALCDKNINPNTLPGRLIAGLLEHPLVVGDDVKEKVEGCKDKPFLVMVSPGPKGGKPGVQSCSKPPPM